MNEPFMLIIKVQCPIYKFIYSESEPVLLAGDTSERQSLTRSITHYIKVLYSLSLINTQEVSAQGNTLPVWVPKVGWWIG